MNIRLIEQREFWRQLSGNLAYETPGERRPSLPARLGVPATIQFHSRVLGVVFRSWADARMNRFDAVRFAIASHDILRGAESCGGAFEISGLQHVASLDRAAVFVCNHMSLLETFVLPCLLLPFGGVAFVIKASLTDYPVFGIIMRATQPIAVSRTDPRQDLKQVFEQGVRCLGEGRSVVVFPQTTRTAMFDTGAFNSLGIKLARQAGVPVIPVALKTDFLANGAVLKDFGPVNPGKTIHFEFGPAMRVDGNGKEQQLAVVQFIAERLKRWGGEVR